MSEIPDSTADKTDSALNEELPTGPGASFTFIYYFSTVAFIMALATAKTFGVGLATPLTGECALVGGAIGGTLGVLFNRSKTLEVSFTNKKTFRQQMNRAFADMRYSLESLEGTVARYQKPNASRFFAGDIYVQERDKSVIFVSRARNIRILERLLNSP